MVKRNAADLLKKLAVGFPLVSITRPRQSGKTTLAQHCFAEKPYVTLEDPDTRDFALHDPRSFLAQFPGGVGRPLQPIVIRRSQQYNALGQTRYRMPSHAPVLTSAQGQHPQREGDPPQAARECG